jgi:alanyl-tRNA synthetase
MHTQDIRSAFLRFFQEQGHAITPSSRLIPENDPTTLFTGSGMQPMVPYLLGEPHPLGTRIADSQKCFRTQDIEEVGDNRHTTFFEMLGNWSLGDFFKREQIPWMFTFLTKELGLDPAKLFVTVFRGNPALDIPRDDEAIALWQSCFEGAGVEALVGEEAETKGLQGARIFPYPEKKNWWSRAGIPGNMPVGEPGGPDSEMFWDFGVERGLHEASPWSQEPCHVNCDCGRFLEIGNNVFMEYVKTETGFAKLPKANVDFGGGLERLAAALQGDPDVFQIDVFAAAKAVLEAQGSARYGESEGATFAFRVVLDHVRAATFLIADGVLPANKDQGYFVRRLLRRAVRFARQLGVSQGMAKVSAAFIDTYASAYPELASGRDAILRAIEQEEQKFLATIEQGLRELKRIVEKTGTFSAEDAFHVYQSYGFPLELTTEELQRSYGLSVDEQAYREAFRHHQDLSRAGSEQKFAGGLADTSAQTTRLHTATHLLHQALRQVLGLHVEQKGSNITAERLRFDFSHGEKLTPDQLAQVERIVNEQIARDWPVQCSMLSVAEAKAQGAIGLFEDTYAAVGNQVKVYTVGESPENRFSMEICGGPHVAHTGELGRFRLLKEEASSAGIRRIKATVEPEA